LEIGFIFFHLQKIPKLKNSFGTAPNRIGFIVHLNYNRKTLIFKPFLLKNQLFLTFLYFGLYFLCTIKKSKAIILVLLFYVLKMKLTKQIMEEFLNFYRNQNFQNDTIENYRRDFSEFMRLFIRR
jgi:hypothetical protein